jgi:hypothetical protein
MKRQLASMYFVGSWRVSGGTAADLSSLMRDKFHHSTYFM